MYPPFCTQTAALTTAKVGVVAERVLARLVSRRSRTASDVQPSVKGGRLQVSGDDDGESADFRSRLYAVFARVKRQKSAEEAPFER